MILEIPPVPPQNNMGGTNPIHEQGHSIQLDWFTCTYKSKLIPPETVEQLFIKFCARVVLKRARFVSAGKRNGFENRRTLVLRDEAASFAWGGNRGFAMIEFRGALCGHLDARAWKLVAWFVRRYDARITRVDVAADFYQGQVDIRKLEKLYRLDPTRVLNLRGNAPRLGHADMGLGRTLYIGARGPGRQICVYEKGRQLGRDQFPDWVRVEVRYRRDADKFEIDPAILHPANWWSYIAGLGPFFSALLPSVAAMKIGYQYKQLHADINTLMRKQIMHVRDTYGPFLMFLSNLVGAQNMALLLSKEGEWTHLKKFPSWQSDPQLLDLLSSSVLAMLEENWRPDQHGA